MKYSPDELKRHVIRQSREQGVSHVLFRNMIGSKLGLNIADMECLDLLFYRGVATPSELSQYTGLSSGATTAMLDRLEKSGLIRRQPNPNDRRGTLIIIVKEATEKVATLFSSIKQAQTELLNRYSPQELELLAGYFEISTALWEEERHKLQKLLK